MRMRHDTGAFAIMRQETISVGGGEKPMSKAAHLMISGCQDQFGVQMQCQIPIRGLP